MLSGDKRLVSGWKKIMWFRSAKEFKEDTMQREAFVDAWLNEPPIDKRFKLIPIIYMKDPNVFN